MTATLRRGSSQPRRVTVGLHGYGSFGRLVAQALEGRVDLHIYDPVSSPGQERFEIAAACDIVILAMPVQRMRAALLVLRPLLRDDCVLIDVSSVKVEPASLMLELAPPTCAILATHPLFGPQSARRGLDGAKIALVPVRGGREARRIAAYLRRDFRLAIHWVTADEHDREMAYVQGLTHLIARIVGDMTLPPIRLSTRTFDLMREMVSLVENDSDDLWGAIVYENPHAASAIREFAQSLDIVRGAIGPRRNR